MLFVSSALDNSIMLFTYMFIYNMSLILFFWTLMSYISTTTKTLHMLNSFSLNPTTVFVLTVLLMSMSGVPPFMGFFSKLFLITLIMNYSFFTLYFTLFVILFFSLYFYIQNIRFIHSTNTKNSSSNYLINERINIAYHYLASLLMIFIIFGFIFIDDLLLFFSWLLL